MGRYKKSRTKKFYTEAQWQRYAAICDHYEHRRSQFFGSINSSGHRYAEADLISSMTELDVVIDFEEARLALEKLFKSRAMTDVMYARIRQHQRTPYHALIEEISEMSHEEVAHKIAEMIDAGYDTNAPIKQTLSEFKEQMRALEQARAYKVAAELAEEENYEVYEVDEIEVEVEEDTDGGETDFGTETTEETAAQVGRNESTFGDEDENSEPKASAAAEMMRLEIRHGLTMKDLLKRMSSP